VPSFLYKMFPKQKLGYNARADRFVAAELTVRDVCAACNNGPRTHAEYVLRELPRLAQ
jgi:hypothetical protein